MTAVGSLPTPHLSLVAQSILNGTKRLKDFQPSLWPSRKSWLSNGLKTTISKIRLFWKLVAVRVNFLLKWSKRVQDIASASILVSIRSG